MAMRKVAKDAKNQPRAAAPPPTQRRALRPADAATLPSTISTYAPTPVHPPTDAVGCRRQRAADDHAGLTPAQLRELYVYLYRVRRLEEHLVALYRQGQVVGGVYRSLGQEATAVGCAYGMRDGDFVQPLIRDLGAVVVHGVYPIAILRQYMARGSSPTAGRDLNMHFSAPEHGIVGPVSMLGTAVPVVVGCLLAARLRGETKAALAFIGDGGSSTGAFYEGMNFAAVMGLPLVMVIEANHYAYSTPTAQQVPHGDLLCRARGFGVTVAELDGNDVLACYEATAQARARGLAGDGPSILLAHTYRRKGHAEHDNQAYVADGEADAWATHNDPVRRYEELLTAAGHASAATLQALRQEVDAALDADRDQAVQEPFPTADQQPLGVFADASTVFPPPASWIGAGPPHRPKAEAPHA